MYTHIYMYIHTHLYVKSFPTHLTWDLGYSVCINYPSKKGLDKRPDKPWFWIKFKHWEGHENFPCAWAPCDGPGACRDFPAHPTTDILSCSSELLPTGSTLRLPVPAPDWFVSLWVLCVPWAVWCLRHTQVLDGTQAQVQEKSWRRFLMFARDWSVLRAPALPCEHSQCKSECVQHDWHPGISPPLCWWHFPNKLILFLVHLSSTD